MPYIGIGAWISQQQFLPLGITRRRRRDDALPSRHYRAAQDKGGILIDNYDRALCTLTHGAPGIFGQHYTCRRGGPKRVLDLLILGPTRGTKTPECQRDPTLADLAVWGRLNPECPPNRCGNRRIADNAYLQSTHRARRSLAELTPLFSCGEHGHYDRTSSSATMANKHDLSAPASCVASLLSPRRARA